MLLCLFCLNMTEAVNGLFLLFCGFSFVYKEVCALGSWCHLLDDQCKDDTYFIGRQI